MIHIGSTENHYRLAINEILKIDKNKKIFILEIGPGPMILKKFLSKNFIYHTMDNASDFWKEKYTFDHNLDGGKFPIKDRSYDVVICLETLEHIMYPEKVLKEILRISKKDAIFFFSMPNEYNFVMRYYYLIAKKTKVDEPFKVVEKNLHIHKPRVKDIINLFSKYFKIEKIDYIWQSRLSEKSLLAREIDKFVQKLAELYPDLFARTVSVKCRRKI